MFSRLLDPTEIVVTPGPDPAIPHLLALVDFRLGPLYIRGVRVVQGARGLARVHWPDEPVTSPCVEPKCGEPVPVPHRFCHACGARQPFRPVDRHPVSGRPWCYRNTVHPASRAARMHLDRAILDAWVEADRASRLARLGVVA